MRHLRMLGLCFVAALAVSAASVTSALAGTVHNPTESLKIYKNCPRTGVTAGGITVEDCSFAATEVAPEGGSYTVGSFTVPFEKQVQLQGGVENFLGYVEEFATPIDGAPAIVPTPEKVPGEPIAHISEAEQNEMGWPLALKYNYRHAKKSALKKVYETIEQAGTPGLSALHILEESGTGIEAPVKIKGENKWISELGDVCYIGSEAEPITQHLTTGTSVSPLTGEELRGTTGELQVFDESEALYLTHSRLVDNTYPVPGASCSGPYSTYIEAAIDKVFEIPAAAGASKTEIKGTLYTATAEEVGRHHLGQ